jgi:hypothetical protein
LVDVGIGKDFGKWIILDDNCINPAYAEIRGVGANKYIVCTGVAP